MQYGGQKIFSNQLVCHDITNFLLGTFFHAKQNLRIINTCRRSTEWPQTVWCSENKADGLETSA